MAITKRATAVRRGVLGLSKADVDPECEITARLEHLAVGLATLADWFGGAPLPDLPPRRTWVGRGPEPRTEVSTGRLRSTVPFTKRSA
jgi:hypothetical protein